MWFRAIWQPTSRKKRRERVGPPATIGVGQLQDGLDDAAQTEVGHGSARSKAVAGRRLGGRSLLGWRGRECAGTADLQKGAHRRRGGSSQPAHSAHPVAPHCGYQTENPAWLYHGGHRAGQHSADRRIARLSRVAGLRPRTAGAKSPAKG